MSSKLDPYLKLMADKGASDVFFTTGAPVSIKIEGRIHPINKQDMLKPGDVQELANDIMSPEQRATFAKEMEMNLAVALANVGRFRVNIFRQRGEAAMVIRYIKTDIPTLEQLNLPPVMNRLITSKRGLVLMVGSTGSGKSTSLAAMIDYRNDTMSGHILTIEDPIEFIYKHKKSLVNQREIGLDSLSYHNALREAMREAPDMILIGEIRDRATMEYAIAYAETGHLCVSTLHANNANQALDRIINFFPTDAHNQLLMDLSLNLKALVSQRLMPREQGRGRVAAVEILLNTPLIADMIFKGEVGEMKELMKRSRELGMQTFDQALFDLYESNLVTYEDILRNADSVNDLRLQVKLHSQRARNADLAAGTEHLTIV